MPKPASGLAPMDGVSDAAFRYIVAKYGEPDFIFTEFTSAEGIRAGSLHVMNDLRYSELERPIVAQLFGSDPKAFYVSAVLVSALGFNGIDINMGCPAKNIIQKGAGASLILNPEIALEIIRETQRGVRDWMEGISLVEAGIPEPILNYLKHYPNNRLKNRKFLPVGVKTRIGYKEIQVKPWISRLLETNPAVISVHGRTLAQLYSGTADWEAIADAAAIAKGTGTLILGNGDIKNRAQGYEKSLMYNLDGFLIGRAALGNPWVFKNVTKSFLEKLQAAWEQAVILNEIYPQSSFLRIRKHLMEYCKDYEGAKQLRSRLLRVNSLEDIRKILNPLIPGFCEKNNIHFNHKEFKIGR